MRFAAVFATAVVLVCCGLLPAQAEKRVALVIGNDRYSSLPQLHSAVADARLMAETLRNDLQFKVIAGENLDYRATNRLQAEFEAAIGPGDTAFVFFAGHGVALGAENYLLPTDTEKPAAGADNLVRSEAHAVDGLIRRVQARGAAASFFVIDACRDNPFEAVGVRSIGNSRGLARANVPTGVFVLFSAGLGQTALDRLNDADGSPNSVFTRTLVPLLRQPGLTHIALAKRVQTDVRALAASVSHQQQPAFYDQIDGEVVLRAALPLASPQPKPPAIVPPLPDTKVAVVAPPARPEAPCGPSPAVSASLAARPSCPLSVTEAAQLKPKDVFRECDTCPEMVVVPAGSFTFGKSDAAGPEHQVTIGKPFAVGKFAVTFDEWDACVAGGGCNGYRPSDQGWGRGRRPAINISWNDAKAYVAWLARKTGQRYRLLSTAEAEYLMQSATTPFPQQTSAEGLPVDAFDPDPRGISQMHGSVREWGEDCIPRGDVAVPSDGSAWTAEDCRVHFLSHGGGIPGARAENFGFRLARTL